MRRSARVYITFVIVSAVVLLIGSLVQSPLAFSARLGIFFVLTVLGAAVKARIPHTETSVSLSFLFLLTGAALFTLSQAILLAGGAALVQSLWRPKRRPLPVQIGFSAAALMISVAVAHALCASVPEWFGAGPATLLIAASGFYATNTVLVTCVIALVEGRGLNIVWQQCHLWAFPYHLVGAILLGIVAAAAPREGMHAPVAVLPLMLLAHLCYRTLTDRAQRERSSATSRVDEGYAPAA